MCLEQQCSNNVLNNKRPIKLFAVLKLHSSDFMYIRRVDCQWIYISVLLPGRGLFLVVSCVVQWLSNLLGYQPNQRLCLRFILTRLDFCPLEVVSAVREEYLKSFLIAGYQTHHNPPFWDKYRKTFNKRLASNKSWPHTQQF